MDSSQRAELLRRIYSIVTAAGSSPIVRRHFHYRAKEALRDYALPGRAPAAGLPVNLDLLDVYLDELSVFGPDDAPACAEPPLPVRLVVYGAKPLALLHDVEPALHSARAGPPPPPRSPRRRPRARASPPAAARLPRA